MPFLLAAFFFPGHPYIGSTTILPDVGMTRKEMAANRKGIGLTMLKRACNSTTNTHTKYFSVVMHKTLCSVWLTFVWRENETVQNCPIVLRNSSSSLSFLIHCNSRTTQATELTQTCTQIALPILQSSPIKEGTRHM